MDAEPRPAESAVDAAPPLVARAAQHPGRVAVAGEAPCTHGELLERSCKVARALLRGHAGHLDLAEERVAYLVAPGAEHVAVQWGIWRAGGVAVPLAAGSPVAEHGRVLADSQPALALADEAHLAAVRTAAAAHGIAVRGTVELASAAEGAAAGELPPVAATRRALMIYTSGTTGRPKGVVTTHADLTAQVTALVQAWGWSSGDRILHVLPLHHVHGIVNALGCALWAGASCEFLAFRPEQVWERLASGTITLFMAVPTIYFQLIRAWEAASPSSRRRWSDGARSLRLMVSGSAPLPVATMRRWEQITGHRLLERYGMTEIGMALSNPLEGERRAGTVGAPLPGVQARLVDEHGAPVAAGEPGEIEVRGAQVFLEYWNRPEETAAAFRDGWFRTGDTAVIEDGRWRILGRTSVDIIKTGGFKVSALEIEEALRACPGVADAAVVAVADPEWGERVCAGLVAQEGTDPDPEQVRAWCKERLAPYKVPRQLAILDDLPRNAMGKVLKGALRARFEA